MRYILYLFTLALVFVSGMLVGNLYLPVRNAALATSISVPGAEPDNEALAQSTLDRATRNLDVLDQALTACPVVVNEEKDRLFKQINLLLARQDFEIKKARYELEIAKNIQDTRTTAEFAKAGAEYAAAYQRLTELANAYFPPETGETPADGQTEQTKTPDKEPGDVQK